MPLNFPEISGPSNPLPEGYKLYIWPMWTRRDAAFPGYLLRTPTATILLSPVLGELLSILATRPGFLLYSHEIYVVLRSGRENGRRNRPESTGSLQQNRYVSSRLCALRKLLLAHGVGIGIDSSKGRHGYTFRGFFACDPVPDGVAKRRGLNVGGHFGETEPLYKDIPWMHPNRIEHSARIRAQGKHRTVSKT